MDYNYDIRGKEGYYYGCANNLGKEDRRLKKFREQRDSQFGFDDTETWSLDCSLSKLIVVRLKRFKEVTIAYPNNFKSLEDWKKEIDIMIEGFELYINRFEWDTKRGSKTKFKKVDKSLSSFKKHFHSLWW